MFKFPVMENIVTVSLPWVFVWTKVEDKEEVVDNLIVIIT